MTHGAAKLLVGGECLQDCNSGESLISTSGPMSGRLATGQHDSFKSCELVEIGGFPMYSGESLISKIVPISGRLETGPHDSFKSCGLVQIGGFPLYSGEYLKSRMSLN